MEKLKNIFTIILTYVALIFCIVLIVIGQKSIGYQGLSIMLIGLGGILIMLYFYNKKYK